MNKIAIIDAHQDLFWATHHKDERVRSQTNIEMIKRNLKIVHLSIFLDDSEVEGASQKQLKEATLRQLHWYRELIENDRQLMLVEHANDVKALISWKDKVGVILHFEGAESVDSPHFVEQLFKLGVRSIGLVWNRKNLLASPAKNDDGEGLSRLGHDVIYKMIDLGIIIDVAHLNESGVYDVYEICKASHIPFINSHANCKGRCDHVRNVTDEQLHMIKEVNGVIGLTAISTFASKNKPVEIESVIDHIKYAVEKMGISHVALGTDFGGILADSIERFACLDDLPHFARQLQDHFNEAQTEQILWHNWRNLYRRVLR